MGQDDVAMPDTSVICDVTFLHHSEFSAVQVPGRLNESLSSQSGALFMHDSANQLFTKMYLAYITRQVICKLFPLFLRYLKLQ